MIRDPTVPRRRILWRTVTTWRTTYKRGKGTGANTIVVKSIGTAKPPLSRTFRTGHGSKKFKAVQIQRSTKEIIIMAKAAKKTKPEVEDIEDAELDELDELEELEDVDEVDEDEDAEEEAPAKSKKGSSKKDKKTKPSRSRTTDGKIGTAELAAKAGVDARTLRMVLRKHNVSKDDETGRYEWDSFENKTVKKILKLVESGEAENIKKESLDRLKETQAEKKKAAKAAKKDKKGKKNKKAKVVEEDEDDE